ncbi:MAG: FtsW/RodA/SpoVE family cell cycle protein [candidate division WOR-3 bacterium]
MKNRIILLSALLLCTFGVLNLLPSVDLVIRQTLYILFSLGIFLFVRGINIRVILEFSRVLYIITLVLLILVLFVGTGSGGVNRWINLGIINFQPSELAKVSIPLFLLTLEGDIKKLIAGLVPAFLILIEPDLATSTVIVFLTWIVVFITTRNLPFVIYLASIPLATIFSFSKIPFGIFLGAISLSFMLLRVKFEWLVGAILSLIFVGLITPVIWERGLKDYQRKRILAIINPSEHTEKLWQTYQSRIALANAGPFGKGIYGATQKLYGYLPASHTDFAFSSFVETYGFVGGFIVLSLTAIMVFSILSTAFSEDVILRNISVVVGSFFTYQSFANMMSVFGVFPVAGIPYPFLSFGGSHIISEWLFLAVLFSAYTWKTS